MNTRRSIFHICAVGVIGLVLFLLLRRESPINVKAVSWAPEAAWVTAGYPPLAVKVENLTDRTASVQVYVNGKNALLDDDPGPAGTSTVNALVPPRSERLIYATLDWTGVSSADLDVLLGNQEEADAAKARYASWPKWIRAWLLKKYQVSSHRHEIKVPAWEPRPVISQMQRVETIDFLPSQSATHPAVVVTSPSELPSLVGQRVELAGVVSNTKCPYVQGVDMWALEGHRGQTVKVTGILRQWIVTQADIDALPHTPDGIPMVAHRGSGTFYSLDKMHFEVLE